ncbi:MAG: DUF3343 domain-containing protein [Bacillota bacterium]
MKGGKQILLTFVNVSEAIRLEKICIQAGIEGSLIPTPRWISNSCSLSWSSPYSYKAAILGLAKERGLQVKEFREY